MKKVLALILALVLALSCMAAFAEEETIRDVIAFPLNGNAQDLMMGAPGTVTEQQLRETHIKIRD